MSATAQDSCACDSMDESLCDGHLSSNSCSDNGRRESDTMSGVEASRGEDGDRPEEARRENGSGLTLALGVEVAERLIDES